MKQRIFHFLILLFLVTPLFAQQFEGSYKYNNDSICFTGDKVIFNLSDFSALQSQIVGEGTYTYDDNFLIINTGDYSGNKSSFSKQELESEEQASLSVKGIEGYPFSGALVEYLSKSGKPIKSSISNEEGLAEFNINDKIKTIKVSHLGYNDIIFDYDPKANFEVILAKHNVIQNQTVIIELKEESDEEIVVRLLTENFVKGKSKEKALDKELKRANKANVLSKRLKKEYVSTFYNR